MLLVVTMVLVVLMEKVTVLLITLEYWNKDKWVALTDTV